MLSIVDLSAAEQVQIELLELLFNFTAERWAVDDDAPFTREEQFACAGRAACGLGSSYNRLRFEFFPAKYQILAEAARPFVQDRVTALSRQLLDRYRRCPKCLDLAFSYPWAKLLSPGGQQRAAHHSLHAVIPVMPFTGVRAELKHLLGKDQHQPKKRGRAPKPHTLAVRTGEENYDSMGREKTSRRAVSFSGCRADRSGSARPESGGGHLA